MCCRQPPLPPPPVFTLLSGEVVSGQLAYALLWSANPPNLELKWVLCAFYQEVSGGEGGGGMCEGRRVWRGGWGRGGCEGGGCKEGGCGGGGFPCCMYELLSMCTNIASLCLPN